MTPLQMLAKLKYMDAEIQAMIKLVELDIELEAAEAKPATETKTTKKRAKREPVVDKRTQMEAEFEEACKKAPDKQKIIRIIREVNLNAKSVKDLTDEQLEEILPDIKNLSEE